MYIHPKLVAFNETLEKLFHEVDEALENRWGDSFPLHPNRPERGQACNPEMDGLFEIAPDFTLGLSSPAHYVMPVISLAFYPAAYIARI